MTREKYESLPLSTLKEVAKTRGLRGISTMKKADLIDLMLEEDDKVSIKEAKEEVNPKKPEPQILNSSTVDVGEWNSGSIGWIRIYSVPRTICRARKMYMYHHRRSADSAEDRGYPDRKYKSKEHSLKNSSALLYLTKINGMSPAEAGRRMNFENMTPIFPNERLRLEAGKSSTAMRVMDLISPIGKGQRGMIVSPPKAGKTTLLKQVALSMRKNNPEIHLLILLIDERPEEVTDIKEAIEGDNVEVIYSTFDELPEHHKRVSEMVIERAKRLVEHKKGRCDPFGQHYPSGKSIQPGCSTERTNPVRWS